MRLVKTATRNAQPCTRFSASECEETSMHRVLQPASTISRNRACRSEDSGVVRSGLGQAVADAVLHGADEPELVPAARGARRR